MGKKRNKVVYRNNICQQRNRGSPNKGGRKTKLYNY